MAYPASLSKQAAVVEAAQRWRDAFVSRFPRTAWWEQEATLIDALAALEAEWATPQNQQPRHPCMHPEDKIGWGRTVGEKRVQVCESCNERVARGADGVWRAVE